MARGFGEVARVEASEGGFLEIDVLRGAVGSVDGRSTSMPLLGACGGEGGFSAVGGSDVETKVRSGEGADGIDGAGGSMRLEIGEAPDLETGLGGVWVTCGGTAGG